jgi:hypothetical protein
LVTKSRYTAATTEHHLGFFIEGIAAAASEFHLGVFTEGITSAPVGLGNPAPVGLLVVLHLLLVHFHELLAKSACLAKAKFLESGNFLVNALGTNFLGGLYAVLLTETKKFSGRFSDLFRGLLRYFTFFAKTESEESHFIYKIPLEIIFGRN